MSRYQESGAALVLTLALVGCGGGEPPDLYPLEVGDVHVLSVDDGTVDRLTVGPTTMEDGQPMTPVERATFRFGESSTELVSKTNGAVWRLVGPSASGVDAALGRYKLLNLPLRAGDRFVAVDQEVDGGVDVDGDGQTERVAVRITVDVPGVGPMVVAGRLLEGVAQVHTERRERMQLSRTGGRYDRSVVLDEWYAPRLGLVRDRRERWDGAWHQVQVRTLLAWALDGERSESQAPTVVDTTPAAGARIGPRTPLVVRFSEAVSQDNRTTPAVRVLGPTGHVLPLSWSLDGRVLSVSTFGAWPTGPLRLELSDRLRDMLGNPLVPVTLVYEADPAAGS